VIAAASKLREWRENPVSMVRELFRAEPDEWQRDLLMAFPKHNRLAGMACKGPGKTAGLAWMGWNFLLTRPHSKVPCTSITGDNLADGLWSEFSAWHKRSPLLQRSFVWTKTRIHQVDNPETWFASARSWSKDADATQQANTLAGVHADYVCFLIDESSDIPDGVVAAAEGALTSGKETKLVIMGNATRTSGPLYRAFTTDRRMWFLVKITGDPDDPKRSPRINVEEARKQIEKYGRDSYIVKVNILGEFPDRQADKLLGAAQVAEAMERGVPPAVFQRQAKVMGLDVARFGDDDASISMRQGLASFPFKQFHGLDNVELAEAAMKLANKWDADHLFVDGTGNGSGVCDTLKHRGFKRFSEIHFGMRATDPLKFENRRAEMHWEAAEWVKGGGALPKDPLLSEELCAPIFWYDKRQRICLESKEDIKSRLGRSPDRADAFVLTFAGPVMARGFELPEDLKKPRPNDYDPYPTLSQEPGSDYDPYNSDRSF
jgi:phage terminase large subunit